MSEVKERTLGELVRGPVKVELVDIGEGWDGDYDDHDSEDDPLLRFYVSRYNAETQEWEEVEDGSYCTSLVAEIRPEQRQQALEILMGGFYEPVRAGESVRAISQRLSWISRDWLPGSAYPPYFGAYQPWPGLPLAPAAAA